MKKLILAVVIGNLLTACGDGSDGAISPSLPSFDIINDKLCEDTFKQTLSTSEHFFCSTESKEQISDSNALKANAYPSLEACQAALTNLVTEQDTYTNKQCFSGTIETIPPTEILPAIKTYQGSLLLNGKTLSGHITCNDQILGNTGHFTFKDGDNVSCSYGSLELLDQDIPLPEGWTRDTHNAMALDMKDEWSHAISISDGAKVLSKISTCPAITTELCLDELDSFDVAPLFSSGNNQDIDAFLNPPAAEETDEVDKAPSSHVDSALTPEVTPGAKPDINADFVSASAEDAYTYKPSADAQVLTESVLSDVNGKPIAGINYYTKSSRGITDSTGTISYVWGETITFGLDTFTFGSVKGNQVEYKLSDVSENEIVKQNVDALTARYANTTSDSVTFSDNVHSVFAQYPNVINEIINLNLPNGAEIENSGYFVPNEFNAQFATGLAQIVDSELNQNPNAARLQASPLLQKGQYVTNTLTQLYTDVDQFHVFHDNSAFYGEVGYARFMRSMNTSNTAFPLLMPRNDVNYWLPFGSEQAYRRDDGFPHVTDATIIDAESDVTLKRPEKVGKDTATYNLPVVTAGEIGQGNVVFMGNSMYPNILSTPESYWAGKEDAGKDNGSMPRFFSNMFTWFTPEYANGKTSINVGSNIGKVWQSNVNSNKQYDFYIDESYQLNMEAIASGSYDAIDPKTTPILILQAYETGLFGDGMSVKVLADITKPLLTETDITALIKYINAGGNVLFMDGIEQLNPEPIARLADTAGISLGGANLARTRQAYCGESYYCQAPYPNARSSFTDMLVTYEKFDDMSKFIVNQDGTVTFPSPIDKPEFGVAQYKTTNSEGIEQNNFAFFSAKTETERLEAVAKIKSAFPKVKECTDPNYDYEIGCIETRKGHGFTTGQRYYRPRFTRYEMSPDVVATMVKAANLGANVEKLYQHEIYYRSKGKEGSRLSLNELNQTYDNLSIWFWNDEQYSYNADVQDELGFKKATEFLNCYTSDAHQPDNACAADTFAKMQSYNMLTETGELNPSYPLNYQEKPLTRIMLGRSYWDNDISVDTSIYPGNTAATGSNASVKIETFNNAVVGTANNMQSTGLWAIKRTPVTVTGDHDATITIALVDDVTGKHQHELALKRPSRVQKSWTHKAGTSTEILAPYGGLIYIKPAKTDSLNTAEFSFNGVLEASMWKAGQWVNQVNTGVPLAEIITGHFVYTTPVNNVSNTDMATFSQGMNDFAEKASNFHARDNTIGNMRFTGDLLPEHSHRFVNDAQISIGAAHSGYPVMSTTYNRSHDTIPTNPVNDWLLWHEVGHNLAAAPFNVKGATEVANNILALYMQEQRDNGMGEMDRIKTDIQKAPMMINREHGHVWSHGDAGSRLVMFAQLKIWGESHFKVAEHFNTGEVPSYFGADEGWNMIKMMHREARNIENQACSAQNSLDLREGNLLMACASQVSGYDLTSFFEAWNPSEVSVVTADGTRDYEGGITTNGVAYIKSLNLATPAIKPETISSIN
ncbi:SslE/AcfD family lipoprotein zinc metalloprotease [Shewanella marinintestina]|uniref:SslE/AcfD family lipoprotein zinc metalloprotease n=1 Tax=Shewanella marinintestina TaxID=190305 RepID=UPI00200E8C93|nr:SslE/AcfD family lipoprotein zinc metalloprotease [Shewanella marinintestina]MCL1147995.1 SslE/AcfD family lipoprotein zinc metalloprotease [Shewanella marinintestina]